MERLAALADKCNNVCAEAQRRGEVRIHELSRLRGLQAQLPAALADVRTATVAVADAMREWRVRAASRGGGRAWGLVLTRRDTSVRSRSR